MRRTRVIPASPVGQTSVVLPATGERIRILLISLSFVTDATLAVPSRTISIVVTPAASGITLVYSPDGTAAISINAVATWAPGLVMGDVSLGTGVDAFTCPLPSEGIIVEQGDEVLVVLSNAQVGDQLGAVLFTYVPEPA